MNDLFSHVRDHLALALLALGAALVIVLTFAAVIARLPALRVLCISASNVVRVIPSLALLALMIPLVGVGFFPAAIALTLLAIPPIAINTDLGLRGVPREIIEAARGLGMTPRQIRMRIEWPLALPVIFAGIRMATVEVISSATLAAFVGGGGLGEFILNGLANNEVPTLLQGALSVSLLALGAQVLLGAIERRLTLRAQGSHA